MLLNMPLVGRLSTLMLNVLLHRATSAGSARGTTAHRGIGTRQKAGARRSASVPPNKWRQSMGWEALRHWGEDIIRIEQLTGGVANEVWSVRLNGQLAVGRLGARSDADLAWETELLNYLDREGMTVPVPIP